MANDYGAMQDRIANELTRSDLGEEIKLAIQSAINHYNGTPFWFTEAIATASTVAGTRYYALPTDFFEMDTLKVTLPGDYLSVLLPRTWQEMEEMDTLSTGEQGYPKFYSIFASQFRLYPVPMDVYTLTLSYIRDLPTLTDLTDTNTWMTDGEALIRCRAKWELYTHVIGELEMAQAMAQAEQMAYRSLRERTTHQNSTGRLRPTYF